MGDLGLRLKGGVVSHGDGFVCRVLVWKNTEAAGPPDQTWQSDQVFTTEAMAWEWYDQNVKPGLQGLFQEMGDLPGVTATRIST